MARKKEADAVTAQTTAEPQTDMELESEAAIASGIQDTDDDNSSPAQTDLESTEKSDVTAEESSEFLISEQSLQTDSEIATVDELIAEDAVEFQDSPPNSHTDSDNPEKEGSQANPDENQNESDRTSRRRSPNSTRARRSETHPSRDILPIDEERTVESEYDKSKNELLDLLESQRARKIMTATLEGVERLNGNSGPARAVLHHGDYKIVIPAEEFVEAPTSSDTEPIDDAMYHMIIKRLGAEIDFIVKGIDADANVAVASRLEAMHLKRRQFYNGRNRNGEYLLRAGVRAEARIVSVTRMSVFVDLFGLEVRIPVSEATYQRMASLISIFQPGQRVLVRVLDIVRQTADKPKVRLSIKSAYRNPYEQAIERYEVGNRYTGVVSMIDTNGVYVSLPSGVDCLCNFPRRGRPPKGARVTVVILGINYDLNRIWGNIVHVVNPT